MGLTNTKVMYFIENKIKIEGTEIKVKSGKCRFNFRCHMNAVHDAIKKKDKQVAMVMCMSNTDSPFIHFINIHKGKYVDNTLGVWKTKYTYYLIKVIDKPEFFNIQTIFDEYREYLNNCTPFYLRWFSNLGF